MPAMPRVSGKATKIAYRILGVPLNVRTEKKTKKERRINKALVFEETRLVR